jgi:hypothetical protein
MCQEPELLGPLSVPGIPSDALPGSELKIRVMMERAARRESLFHPLDGICASIDGAEQPAKTTAWWHVAPVEPQALAAELEDFEDSVEAEQVEDGAENVVLPLVEYAEQASIA